MLKSSAKVFLSWGSFLSLQTALLIPVKYRTSKVFAISPWWNHEQHINSEEWPEISFKRAKSDIRDLQGAKLQHWKGLDVGREANQLVSVIICQMRPLMAVTEGVQEQQHHYIICFSSQLVPIHFSNLGPTPACCESEGYRDKVCVSWYTLFAFCRDQCAHHPCCHFWVELHKGFAITYTTITVLHNKNECPSTQGWQSVLWVWYSRDWIPLAAWSIRLRNHYA